MCPVRDIFPRQLCVHVSKFAGYEKGMVTFMKKIGIVICNYNKEDAVLECIQSILESRFQDFDLFVVDNGSTDQSVKRIKEKYASSVTL